jgi:peptidoglycan/xylan/chitin deacetylase (PgdA/CDA1 family)
MKKMQDSDRLATLAELRASADGDPITQRQPTSNELRTLDAEGMAVENHSQTHPLLDKCDDDKVTTEVVSGALKLQEILGRPMRAFAYPNGNWDDRAVSSVRDTGNEVAFTFNHRIDKWTPGEPLLMSRVRVNSDGSIRRFAAIVSGVHPACHALRGGK